MAKGKIKKIDLPPTERCFGVVLENIDSKLDLVVDGVETLDKKIEKVDNLKTEMDYKFGIVLDELSLIR